MMLPHVTFSKPNAKLEDIPLSMGCAYDLPCSIEGTSSDAANALDTRARIATKLSFIARFRLLTILVPFEALTKLKRKPSHTRHARPLSMHHAPLC